LLKALKARFEKNMNRHKGLEWAKVKAKLEASAEKLWSLNEMERTGGEPDVVGHDKKMGEYIFFDCSAESPNGRRSVCYDREGQESRKEHKPENNAIDMAAAMGIELLTEVNLPRFDGHGNSKKERGPDGSKKERAPGLYGAIQKSSGGDGDPQRQEFGADCARAWM
jgi:hypothetical protein